MSIAIRKIYAIKNTIFYNLLYNFNNLIFMNKVNFSDEASRMSVLRNILESNLAKDRDCATTDLLNAELKLYNAVSALQLFCEEGARIGKVENKKVPQILAQKLSDYLQTEEYEKAEYQSETGIVDRNLKTRFETVIKLAQALSE